MNKLIFDNHLNRIGEINYYFNKIGNYKRKNLILNHKNKTTVYDPETGFYSIKAYDKYELCNYKYTFFDSVEPEYNNLKEISYVFDIQHAKKCIFNIANINVIIRTNLPDTFNYNKFFEFIGTTDYFYEYISNKKISFKLFLNSSVIKCPHISKKDCSCAKLIMHKTGNFILSGVTKENDIPIFISKIQELFFHYLKIEQNVLLLLFKKPQIDDEQLPIFTFEEVLIKLYNNPNPNLFIKKDIETISLKKFKKIQSIIPLKLNGKQSNTRYKIC
jgi:hypothetical protein